LSTVLLTRARNPRDSGEAARQAGSRDQVLYAGEAGDAGGTWHRYGQWQVRHQDGYRSMTYSQAAMGGTPADIDRRRA
jgi:hypothetical protein